MPSDRQGRPGTPGTLFEWAHATEDGFRVISVFETEADAQANLKAVGEAAATVLAAQGLPPLPEDAIRITFLSPLACYLAHPSPER